MSKTFCKYFSAKSPSFGMVGSGKTPFDLENDNLATCWCIKTQSPMAPDSGFVAPSACVAGRKCYVEAEG